MKRKVVAVRRSAPTSRHDDVTPRGVVWIGARAPTPLTTREDAGMTIDLVGWVCDGIILDMNVVSGDAPPDALVESLRRAKAAGRAPPPSVLRVADASVVSRIQQVFSHAKVELGPTPEMSAVFDAFIRSTQQGEPTVELLTLGAAHPADVARFCAAAATLYRQAPWDILASDDDVMCVDAPSVGLSRACVTVMGQLRETFGVMWIDTPDDYRRYREALALRTRPGGPPPVAVRAITYEPVEAMPPDLRREFMRRKWALAGAAAMPFPIRLDDEGHQAPFLIDDLRTATVVFEGISKFLAQHGAAVRSFMPAAGTYPVAGAKGEVTVQVTYPHPGHTGPVDNDDGAFDENVGDLSAQALAVCRAMVESTQPEAFREARDEMAFAFLGRRASAREIDALPPLQSSLVNVWASLWRPLRRGGRGLEVLAATPQGKGAFLAEGIEVHRKARVVYGEVLELRAESLVLRDFRDGARYEIVSPPDPMRRLITRWMRTFAVLTPRPDGRWNFPSVLLGTPQFASIAFDELLAKTRETLVTLGKGADAIDPAAPAAGMLAWAGVVLATLMRISDERERAPKPRKVLMNSDGDVVEFVDAVVTIPLTPKAIDACMAAAPGFVSTGPRQWDLIDPARNTVIPGGESLGALLWEKRRWVVRASSPRRVDAMLDRLAALFGQRPGVKSRTHRAPWEDGDAFARAPGDGIETTIIANGPMPATTAEEAHAIAVKYAGDHYRALLDQVVPVIGGAPRALVATPEGRARVEQWLHDGEAHGNVTEAGRWLDLDPLRRELGLPTIA